MVVPVHIQTNQAVEKLASIPGVTIRHILLPLLVPPYGTYCFHSWCHLTAHIASTPGATIQHILLLLLVPPYSTYCFHSWCRHTAHIASTPGATLQHILLPLLVPPYSTYCFHSWCHLTAHIASTPGATIQHILLPLLVPLWWSQIRPVQNSSKHISRMRAHAQWPLLSVLTRSDVVATAYVMPGSRFG